MKNCSVRDGVAHVFLNGQIQIRPASEEFERIRDYRGLICFGGAKKNIKINLIFLLLDYLEVRVRYVTVLYCSCI